MLLYAPRLCKALHGCATEFKLKTNTGYAWRTLLMNGQVTIDRGWASLIAVHHIKSGCMVTFKLLTAHTLKVIVFDDNDIEVVTKCERHHEAFIVNV
ncbi:Speckle-type POZ protein [Hordeum vulgare]|nr:Speckle-type POZ protein [Hordeum vulgare]